MEPYVDFTITVRSVPSWMVAYTTAKPGYLQWIFATLKIKDSRTNYMGLIDDLLSMLSPSQCKRLEYIFFTFHINVAKPILLFLQSCGCPCSLGGEMHPYVSDFQFDISFIF